MAAPRQPRSAREVYRSLRIAGWDAATAGNLTAIAMTRDLDEDLAPVATGWSPDSIEALLFMRRLVRTGRLAGDTST